MNRPASGSIRIDGLDVQRMPRRVFATKVAYVPQNAAASFPFQVFDVVLMGRTPHFGITSMPGRQDEQHAIEALDRLGIGHLKDRSIYEISGGERQLVMIARALCQEARLLIMDEPTANLDYGNQIRVLQIVNDLRRWGYAIIMTAHNPDHAFRSATHAAILKRGRILAFGDPASIITSESLSELYETRIRVFTGSFPDEPGSEVKACIPLF